jgi:hypothetical protein
MAFYDDGGVDFAQQQLEEARKRREKTAKSQEKFTKNLLILDGLLGIADKAINKKADKLETEGVLARSNYITQLEQSNAFNKNYNDYVAQGYSAKDILEFETKDILEGYFTETYGEGYDFSQFRDGINNIAREWASDPEKLEAFQKQVDAHAQIPNMSSQELVEISRKQDAPPRSVAEFVGNSIFKVFKSHDDNTLSEEDRLAKQRKLGGLLGTQFDNVRTAVEEYGNVGNPIDELVTYIQDNPDKIVFKNAQSSIQPVTRMVGGRTESVPYIISYAQDSDGNTIQMGDPIALPMSIKDTGPKQFNNQEIAKTMKSVEEFILGTNDETFIDNYKTQFKEKPTIMTERILESQDFLINQYGIDRNTAFETAIKYVVAQDSNNPETTPSLYDIDVALGQIDSEKIEAYADSIIQTKPNVLVNSELRKLRDSMINVIATSGSERASEDITTINNIMEKQYNVTTVKNYNETFIKEADIPEETKGIYKDILNTPIVGSAADFLFGEEFGDSGWDYAALIPVGGVAVTGTKTVIGKTIGGIAPKIGNQILKHPTMAKFIDKAKKYADPNKKMRGREMFINNLNPVEKAVFRSMNAKGNIDTMLFMKRLATIPGVYIQKSGLLPGFGTRFGKIGYGGLGAYAIYSSYIDKQEPTEN